MGEGDGQVPAPLPVPVRGRRARRATWREVLLVGARRLLRRDRGQCRLRRPPARGRPDDRRQPRRHGAVADHRRREPDQHLRRRRGGERVPAERAHGRPEPPRDRAARAAARPAPDLPPARARQPVPRAADGDPDDPARDRARDVLAQRPARALLRPARARRPLPPPLPAAPVPRAARRRVPDPARPRRAAGQLLRDRDQVARRHERQGDVDPLLGLRVHPAGALAASALRPRAEQLLGLLRVRHGSQQLRAALVLRRPLRRERRRRGAALRSRSSATSSTGSRWDGRSAGACRLPGTSSRHAFARWSGG